MKNDLRKVDDITLEMQLNDMLYKKMQFDLDIVESILMKARDDDTEYKRFLLDEVYFFRRVLSVLANEDIPFRSCIGLFILVEVLPALFDDKEEYIGDSDIDEDIHKYVIEYGYRQFDEWMEQSENEAMDAFRDALIDYEDLIETEENEDDE